jgi:hypothetical protein
VEDEDEEEEEEEEDEEGEEDEAVIHSRMRAILAAVDSPLNLAGRIRSGSAGGAGRDPAASHRGSSKLPSTGTSSTSGPSLSVHLRARDIDTSAGSTPTLAPGESWARKASMEGTPVMPCRISVHSLESSCSAGGRGGGGEEDCRRHVRE